MRQTICLQAMNIIRTLNRSSTSIANCSCYSSLSYCDGLSALSRTVFNRSTKSTFVISKTILSTQTFRFNSTDVKEVKQEVSSIKQAPDKIVIIEQVSRKDKLKKAVKEYGSTVIVFHIGISLISLGTSYALVSMGLDITSLLESIGLKDWLSNSNIATNAGTFAVAYAIHKVFAPVRITITLASVPFIVRYLRKIGFLKKLN